MTWKIKNKVPLKKAFRSNHPWGRVHTLEIACQVSTLADPTSLLKMIMTEDKFLALMHSNDIDFDGPLIVIGCQKQDGGEMKMCTNLKNAGAYQALKYCLDNWNGTKVN